jgi:hypothetical protein
MSWVSNTAMMSSLGLNDGTRRGTDIRGVPVKRIEVGERQRPLNQATVEKLASSFMTEGQLAPIGVKQGAVGKPYRLIYGYHRVAAAQKLLEDDPTQDSIAAVIFPEKMPDHVCQRYEIVENLIRKELTAKERDAHTVLLLALLKRSGVQKEGRDSPEVNGVHPTEQAAQDLGITRKQIYKRTSNAVKLAERSGVTFDEGKKTPGHMTADKLEEVGRAALRLAEEDRQKAEEEKRSPRYQDPMQKSAPTQATVKLDTLDVKPFIAWCRARLNGRRNKAMSLETLHAYRDALDELIREVEAA